MTTDLIVLRTENQSESNNIKNLNFEILVSSKQARELTTKPQKKKINMQRATFSRHASLMSGRLKRFRNFRMKSGIHHVKLHTIASQKSRDALVPLTFSASCQGILAAESDSGIFSMAWLSP